MAATCFIDGTFFAPFCSVCLKLNSILLSILCFLQFLCFILLLFLFKIIFITFGCDFYKLIVPVEKGLSCTLGNTRLIGVSSMEKNRRND